MIPVIAIIGRPNVGKSTLFNTIAKKNIAIVDDLPGVTRDRNYLDITYDDKSFILIDTGGFDPFDDDKLAGMVKEHAQIAAEEADAIIFLMDGHTGIHHSDEEINRIIQRSNKKIYYVVNKLEKEKERDNVFEFYSLGVDKIFAVSAKNNIGINELFDEITEHFPVNDETEKVENETVVAIVGRPNVGKSSIINKIIGQDRLIVSDIAGTTRDSVDTLFKYNKKAIRFIDTAGIRRKSRISFKLEKYSVILALRSINASELTILLLNAEEGVTAQDMKLASQIYDRKKACIIAVNKWDLIEKDNKSYTDFVKKVRADLSFMDFAPVIPVSALTGQRVRSILDLIITVGDTYQKRVPTSVFNKKLIEIYDKNPSPKNRRNRTRLYYGTQVKTSPPIFKIFTNNPGSFPEHYLKYLERSIREEFGFDGVPVCLQFANHKSDD
jgi:GTP-binding protein